MKNLFFGYSGKDNKVYTTEPNRTKNKKYTFNQLVLKCKSDPPPQLEKVRSIIKSELLKGKTFDDAKKAANIFKKELDWFLPSGFCEIHHNDKDLKNYNGVIQIDIDFKFIGGDQKAKEIKDLIQKVNYIAFAAISPSGYGVKALALTNNEHKAQHSGTTKQVLNDLKTRLNLDLKAFDSLSLSQCCFIPYDKDIYFRFSPVAFKVDTDKLKIEKNISNCDKFLNNATGEAWDICSNYAKSKGFKPHEGTNHLYLTYISICANLLGIHQNEVEQYANELNINVSSNCISKPYQNYSENFGRWADLLLFKSDRKIINGKLGDKLNGLLPIGESFNFNARFIAPTGTGKTFWAIHTKGKKVIVVPTVSLVDGICNDLKYKHLEPLPIHENERNLSRVFDAECIITTYASFPNVCAKLDGRQKEYRLFIDEYHNFSSSTSKVFRLIDLRRCLKLAPLFKSMSLLSGTELFNAHPLISDLPIIEIKIPKVKKAFQFINTTHGIKTVAARIKKAIAKGKFPMVLFNNKGERLNTLKGLLSGVNVAYFNADNKQDAEFKKVVERGTISNEVQCIVSTTVINEGNNIYNENDYEIIIYGMFHPSDIEQFSNRPRKPRSVTGCIIRSKERTNEKTYFRSSKHALWLQNSSQRWCDELNIKSEVSNDLIKAEFISRSHIQQMPIALNNYGLFEVDFLQINNFVFEREKVSCYRDDERMKSELSKYNIIVTETIDYDLSLDPTEKNNGAKSRKEYKQQIQKDFADTLQLLKGQLYKYNFASNKISNRKKQLPKGQNIALKSFVELSDTITRCFGVQPNEEYIFNQLGLIGASNAKLQKLKKQINMYSLHSNKGYMKSNRMFAIILKKIFKEFKEGDNLTGEEMKVKLISCLSIDKTFDTDILMKATDKKITSIIDLFFDRKSSPRRNSELGGKNIKSYKIVYRKLSYVSNNIPLFAVDNLIEKQAIKELETLINIG